LNMNLIYFPPSGTFQYPYSIGQLRQDNPNVSFSVNPTAADMAPFYVYQVTSTPQPVVNVRTQRVEEARQPTKNSNGSFSQAWVIRNATPAEISAYDAANAPQPDWMAFGVALATSPAIATLYAAIPGPVGSGLSTGLMEASKGDYRLFLGLWVQLLAAGRITPALLQTIGALAQQFNLPAEFMVALMPPAASSRSATPRP